jgi:hypothetical protein
MSQDSLATLMLLSIHLSGPGSIPGHSMPRKWSVGFAAPFICQLGKDIIGVEAFLQHLHKVLESERLHRKALSFLNVLQGIQDLHGQKQKMLFFDG